MNKLAISISIVVSALLIGGVVLMGSQSSGGASGVATVVDGKQFIDITAKGGYSPRVVTAKAGMPTVLRVQTNGTFDCSASLVIPKLSYQKFLQSSGIEEITISPEAAQGRMKGLCSMGMYSFEIDFQS